jgi:hypothetical protein
MSGCKILRGNSDHDVLLLWSKLGSDNTNVQDVVEVT